MATCAFNRSYREFVTDIEAKEILPESEAQGAVDPPTADDADAAREAATSETVGDDPPVTATETLVTQQPTQDLEDVSTKQPIDIWDSSANAKRVQFFKEGDRYFKGSVWGVSPQKLQSFESSIVELVNIPFKENQTDIPGKYNFDRSPVLRNIENLSDNASHFLATKEFFNQLASKTLASDEPVTARLSAAATKLSLVSRERDRDLTKLVLELSNEPTDNATPFGINSVPQNASPPVNIVPKTVVVIRNGVKPRRMVRFLMNQQTAHSYEQVLADMGDAVRSEVGTIKKVYGIDGVQILTLADFFKDEISTFIVYGPENPTPTDFELDNVERKWVSHRPRQIFHMSAVASAKRRAIHMRNVVKGRPISALNERSEIDDTDALSEFDETIMKREITEFPAPSSNGQEVSTGFWTTYRLGDLITQSRFSTTHICSPKPPAANDSQPLIVKIIEITKTHKYDAELSLLEKIKHENLVNIIDQVFRTSDAAFVVFENSMGFKLFDAIVDMKLSERKIFSLVKQILHGTRYLHDELKIIHFNINHLTIIVNETGRALLGDFSKAQAIESVNSTPRTQYENSVAKYTSPDIADHLKDLSASCDLYSIGILLLAMLSGSLETRVDEMSIESMCQERHYSTATQSLLIKLCGLYKTPNDSDSSSSIIFMASDALSIIESSIFPEQPVESFVVEGLLSAGDPTRIRTRIRLADVVLAN